MRAIILAAGEGVRLRPYTLTRPKCLVELAGRPLLQWQIDALHGAGVDDVTIVTGYRAEAIRPFGLPTRHNAEYARTNMVASLMCAADLLDGGDDVLVAYADIVYEPRVIEALASTPAPLATTIDRRWRQLWQIRMDDPLSDAETLRLDCEGRIVEIGHKATSYDQIEGQYMGLIKLAAGVAPQITAFYRKLDSAGPYEGKMREGMYMTTFLQMLVDGGRPLRAVPVDGGWLEVDSVTDLNLYNQLQGQGRLDTLCRLPVLACAGACT